MMGNFTRDEINLICIYNKGTRKKVIDELTEMRKYLEADEIELRMLTNSALKKLQTMSDAEYTELELVPDFD